MVFIGLVIWLGFYPIVLSLINQLVAPVQFTYISKSSFVKIMTFMWIVVPIAGLVVMYKKMEE